MRCLLLVPVALCLNPSIANARWCEPSHIPEALLAGFPIGAKVDCRQYAKPEHAEDTACKFIHDGTEYNTDKRWIYRKDLPRQSFHLVRSLPFGLKGDEEVLGVLSRLKAFHIGTPGSPVPVGTVTKERGYVLTLGPCLATSEKDAAELRRNEESSGYELVLEFDRKGKLMNIVERYNWS